MKILPSKERKMLFNSAILNDVKAIDLATLDLTTQTKTMEEKSRKKTAQSSKETLLM